MPKRVLSLFSGCGGLDLGFQLAGFQTVAAFDADHAAVATFNENIGEKAHIADLGQSVELPKDIDVIIAGPPCQGFSTGSGYSKVYDPRNDLLARTCDLIATAKPKAAVIENVAALSNTRNLPYLESALLKLMQAGFHTELGLFNAEDFGVPQARRRLIIVATRMTSSFNFGALKHAPRLVLRDVLSEISKGMQSHDPTLPEIGTKDFIIATRIGQGQKLCNVRGGTRSIHTWDIPEVFGPTTWPEREVLLRLLRLRRTNRKRSFGDADPVSSEEIQSTFEQNIDRQILSLIDKGYIRRIEGLLDLTHTFNGKYKRLKWNDYAPTVDTRFGDIRLFLHPTENRGMTVREAARIQGFPDNFTFPSHKPTAFRLIGNAVPPPLAQNVAAFVRELI